MTVVVTVKRGSQMPFIFHLNSRNITVKLHKLLTPNIKLMTKAILRSGDRAS